jgi:phosphoglycerate dehydrogenase-like enzyme
VARILIYEPAFRRIQQRLAKTGLPVEPVVMSPDGALSLDGRPLAAEDARPDAGWVSSEVFSGPTRAFMIALLKSTALAWVQSGAAGVDDPVFARFVAKGAKGATNHAQADSIAEHVMAGVLDHFQRGPERRAAQAERLWRPLPFREVAGGAWLVFGFGAIGQAVARRAGAFGARIVAVGRRPGAHPLAERFVGSEGLHAALPDVDVVVLCAPLTDATANIAGEAFFAQMKPGSVFVNVARGGLADEDALWRGLDRGAPGHAILDVFRTEQLPAESRFWNDPRISLTPHAAAAGSGRAGNLSRFVRAAPLLNEVSPRDLPGDASAPGT